jgi:hypothetical protein
VIIVGCRRGSTAGGGPSAADRWAFLREYPARMPIRVDDTARFRASVMKAVASMEE